MPPPVLFIHGAFSNPAHFAGWVLRFAQAGFDCHAPCLPGHSPAAHDRLGDLSLSDYLEKLKRKAAGLSEPPIVIGHSMGGLLAQQLAATTRCSALVCVASAPPWMLTAQPASLPALLSLFPSILAGRPIRPPERTLRALAVHDLEAGEQDALLPTFGPESGRAYRSMILGTARLPGPRFAGPVLCLSGTRDRIVSQRTAAAIARHYAAPHRIFDRGHWLIADSAAAQVAGAVIEWLAKVIPARNPAIRDAVLTFPRN